MKHTITKILALVIALFIALTFCGCGNKRLFDKATHFDEAIIRLPDGGTVRGRVEIWRDFSDSDQLQIKIDGIWYSVHSTNAVLIEYTEAVDGE